MCGRTFTTASTSTLNCGSATAASTMVVVFSLVAATAKELRRADTPAWLTPRTRGAAALRRTDATILHGAAAARRTGAAVRETAKGATWGVGRLRYGQFLVPCVVHVRTYRDRQDASRTVLASMVDISVLLAKG